MNEFLTAYITCALWSSNDESRDDGGDPLDDNYSRDDLAIECLESMAVDCAAFESLFGGLFKGHESQAGHDFWLTRNGHGAGFWDRCDLYESHTAAMALSDAAKACGEVDLYVGDDKLVYCA